MKKGISAENRNVDLLVLNHTSVLSGGEIPLVDLLRAGLLFFHVHTDRYGPLTEALAGLPGVTCSSARAETTPTDSDSLGTADPVKAIWLRLRTFIWMRRDYARLLSRINSPIIYSNTLRSTLVICTLRLNGRRLIFHQRDQLSRAYLGRFFALIARLFIRARVSHVIANSASTARSSPLSPSRTAVIPSAVAASFFEVPAPIDVKAPRILMLGRLSPWKGQLQFLHSLVVLRNELENSPGRRKSSGVLFSVNPTTKMSCEHSSQNMNSDLSGGDAWPPSDVEQCLTHSHILVHASILPEPFGQVIAQGMAAGRAVVAANSGGPLEIIRDHGAGLLVDPTKPRTLRWCWTASCGMPICVNNLASQLANRQLGTASVTSPSGFGRS